MAEKIKCPNGHTRVWKKGVVPTVHGKKDRFVCYECGKTFYAPVKAAKTTRKSGRKK